ncbi:DEK domain-containing chromatin associated protein, putative isoform 4 [Hibiscus syriacus]|uniref:DEK domain-containing chromatin associated protein, putative isoform 4 n=1 Tax=Hibiscus syriacus TaxID=106335 RepID=A0A6A3BTL4_HIBSY|nr:DEK domain-containing chromatin associated protein, putative isoform 4 [Hibiscus syriacus]
MEEDEKEEEEEKEENRDEVTKEVKGSSRKRSSGNPIEIHQRIKSRSSTPKPLSIEKGPGTRLKDIPNVAFKLSKRKFDDNLQLLHMILFGKKAKPQRLKRNIGQFSGYVWGQNEQEKLKAKVKEKIEKCVKEKLVDFCDLLNIPITRATLRKEELSAKLLEFLESPHATTDILLADKEQGKKRKATPSKNIAYGDASDTSAKKQRSTPQGRGKHKRSSEVEEKDEDVESPVSKNDSHEDDADTTLKEVSDDEETKSKEEEKSKNSSDKSTSKKSATDRPDSKLKKTSSSEKKATAAKSSGKSSGSISKQGSSGDVRTPGSKLKGSASKKQKVGFSTKNKVTRKKQTTESPAKVSTKAQDLIMPATHFDLDLMHRKAEVKDIITEAINNMSDDDEEGEESEENADTGGDADKDGDGDDDA